MGEKQAKTPLKKALTEKYSAPQTKIAIYLVLSINYALIKIQHLAIMINKYSSKNISRYGQWA